MFSLQSQRDGAFTTAVGTTIRPPTTALLTIDSEDRFPDLLARRAATPMSFNWSPYNFTITKNESLMNGFFTRLGVSEIVFPWTIPNINIKTNTMLLDFQIGSAAVQTALIQITNLGFYTPVQIADLLTALIRTKDATLSGFTLTYGLNGNPAFSYSSGISTTNVAFRPLFANNVVNVITSPADSIYTYPYSNLTKQLFDVLGFSLVNSELTVTGGRAYGGATLCQPIRYVDIICSQLTYNQALKDTSSQVVSRDALCRLYLGNGSNSFLSNVPLNSAVNDPPTVNNNYCPTGCAPFVIYQQYNNPKQIQWAPNQPVPGYLVFQVYDDVGDLLESSLSARGFTLDGQQENWSMTLLVSEN